MTNGWHTPIMRNVHMARMMPSKFNDIDIVELVFIFLHHVEPTQNIVQISHNHEDYEEGYADVFGSNHEFLGWFAPGYHFVKEEHYMSTVKGRHGEDVHEGEDDAQQCSHVEEHIPVPIWWEEASDRAESADAFHSVGRCEVAEVAYVSAKYVYAVFESGWYAF